jgi:hypothetical protein
LCANAAILHLRALLQSMIPKKPAPDLIRGGHRFSEKIMLEQRSWNVMMVRRTMSAF